MATIEMSRQNQQIFVESASPVSVAEGQKPNLDFLSDPEYLWYTETLHKLQSGEFEPGDIPVFILYKNGVADENAAETVARLIIEGRTISRAYVTTYGIEGRGEVVQDMIAAKKETDPSRAFSTTNTFEYVYPTIDIAKLHPDFRDKDALEKFAQIMQDIGFIRYPVNEAVKKFPTNAVSEGQVQVYTRRQDDVLINAINKLDPNVNILLSSANIKGEKEAIDPVYAYEFARQAGVAALVVEDENDLLYANKRHRFGSTPIIQVPRIEDVDPETGKIIIYVYRAANTDFESIERLILEKFPEAMVFFSPDKPEDPRRIPYTIPADISSNLHENLYLSGVPNGLPPYK